MGEKHSEEEWLQNSSFWKLEWARASQDGGGCVLLGVSFHFFFTTAPTFFFVLTYLHLLCSVTNNNVATAVAPL